MARLLSIALLLVCFGFAGSSALAKANTPEVNRLLQEVDQAFKSLDWPRLVELDQKLFRLTKEPKYLYNLGIDFGNMGKLRKSIDALKRYWKLNPVYPAERKEEGHPLIVIAKHAEKIGLCQDTIKALQGYLKLRPDSANRTLLEVRIRKCETLLKDLRPKLDLRSSPSAAHIFLGDKFQGETPMMLPLDPGQYKLRVVKKKYIAKEIDLEVLPNKDPPAIALILERIKEFGQVRVRSEVAGAEVLVDGKVIGKTPLALSKRLAVGKHRVEIRKGGYFSWTRQITLAADETNDLVATLVKKIEPTSKKAVIGWLLVGTAVLSEAAAITFQVRAKDYLENDPAFGREKGLAIGFHVGAAVSAAIAGGLLTWWFLEKDEKKKRARSSNFLVTSSGVHLTW